MLYHKLKSLKALRRSLDHQSAFGDYVEDRDSTLLTVLMHCSLEIATGSRHEWTSHLKGAIALIRSHHKNRKDFAEKVLSDPTLQFVTDYFSSREIFSGTTLNQSIYFKANEWPLNRDASSSSRPDLLRERRRIHLDIGVCQELLDIISSITTLARKKFRLRREGKSNYDKEASFLETANELRNRLEMLTQWSEEPDDAHVLYLNAAAFKMAAHIYLRHGAFDDRLSHSSIQEVYQPALLHLLKLIHEKEGEMLGASPYPMWALFIASCLANESDRAVTLRLFTSLRKLRPASNVPLVMAAVEAIWKRKDLDVETKDVEGKRISFEWDDVVERLGWKLSLS